MSSRRLMRNDDEKMIFGVCSGLSDYLDIDPTLIRLAFLVLLFASGIGLPIYLVLAFVAPKTSSTDSDEVGYEEVSMTEGDAAQSKKRTRFMAGLMVLFGVFFLLGNFDVEWHFLLPILLIGAGIWQITHRDG